MTRQRALREPLYDEEGRGGLLSGIGELIAAHPSIAGGSAAFAVIFSFVSANALWYQPGRHPAPILKTRDSGIPAGQTGDIIGKTIQSTPARQVTTYRIERSDDTPTASIPVPDTSPVVKASGQSLVAATSGAKDMPAPDPLLMKIQKELKRKGFYGGKVDGLMGPMSAAGISNWQEKTGLGVDGKPSDLVLDSLLHGGNTAPLEVTRARPEPDIPPLPETVVTPTPRPEREDRTLRTPPVTVPAAASGGGTKIAAASKAGMPSDLVRRIQSGLSSIAYTNIVVDGVIGQETRNAISAFEKHYGLPQTGEPNRKVLDKLIEIGAL